MRRRSIGTTVRYVCVVQGTTDAPRDRLGIRIGYSIPGIHIDTDTGVKYTCFEVRRGEVMNDWLTTKELAELAGVSQARIRQLCIDGVLQASKGGRNWFIQRTEADRWLASRKPRKKTE